MFCFSFNIRAQRKFQRSLTLVVYFQSGCFLASSKTDGFFQVDFKSHWKKEKNHRQEGQCGKLLKVKCGAQGEERNKCSPCWTCCLGNQSGWGGPRQEDGTGRRKPQLSLIFRCERRQVELGNRKGGTAPEHLVSWLSRNLLVAMSWMISKSLKGSISGGGFTNCGNMW